MSGARSAFDLDPCNPDAFESYDRATGSKIRKGFCASPTCGKRAWVLLDNGVPEPARLCPSCFSEATEPDRE